MLLSLLLPEWKNRLKLDSLLGGAAALEELVDVDDEDEDVLLLLLVLVLVRADMVVQKPSLIAILMSYPSFNSPKHAFWILASFVRLYENGFQPRSLVRPQPRGDHL